MHPSQYGLFSSDSEKPSDAVSIRKFVESESNRWRRYWLQRIYLLTRSLMIWHLKISIISHEYFVKKREWRPLNTASIFITIPHLINHAEPPTYGLVVRWSQLIEHYCSFPSFPNTALLTRLHCFRVSISRLESENPWRFYSLDE